VIQTGPIILKPTSHKPGAVRNVMQTTNVALGHFKRRTQCAIWQWEGVYGARFLGTKQAYEEQKEQKEKKERVNLVFGKSIHT
jgi:hypothetical protein